MGNGKSVAKKERNEVETFFIPTVSRSCDILHMPSIILERLESDDRIRVDTNRLFCFHQKRSRRRESILPFSMNTTGYSMNTYPCRWGLLKLGDYQKQKTYPFSIASEISSVDEPASFFNTLNFCTH